MDELVKRGRLFKLRIERSATARQDALASIREAPGGRWQVRIGGRMRGRTEIFPTRAAAERAVRTHYDAALLKAVQEMRR